MRACARACVFSLTHTHPSLSLLLTSPLLLSLFLSLSLSLCVCVCPSLSLRARARVLREGEGVMFCVHVWMRLCVCVERGGTPYVQTVHTQKRKFAKSALNCTNITNIRFTCTHAQHSHAKGVNDNDEFDTGQSSHDDGNISTRLHVLEDARKFAEVNTHEM